MTYNAGSSVGAAIVAAMRSGWHSSFQEAANAMIRIRKKIKPDPNNYRKYQELFPIYGRLCPCLKTLRIKEMTEKGFSDEI
jgi:sugar (pentulose or hexulose) kinase